MNIVAEASKQGDDFLLLNLSSTFLLLTLEQFIALFVSISDIVWVQGRLILIIVKVRGLRHIKLRIWLDNLRRLLRMAHCLLRVGILLCMRKLIVWCVSHGGRSLHSLVIGLLE